MYVKICLPSSTETWGNGSPDVTSGYVRGSSRETWRGRLLVSLKRPISGVVEALSAVLVAAGVVREVEEGEADLRSWPDLVDLPSRWEVAECVEPFQATVVHCRQGKSPVLSLSFPKCFTGAEICIEHKKLDSVCDDVDPDRSGDCTSRLR
jgi:hypothetical protein